MKLYYDFHLHSCLSPCGDKDMTPNNLVNMAKLLGLEVIALTDHNTAANCRAVVETGSRAGLTVLPGMELCTAEEVHTVCLFDTLEKAEAFSDYVYSTLPKIRNKPAVFGNQTVCDAMDTPLREEELLLITASSLSITAVPALVGEYGGFCFPAHIDRPAYSLISNLGTIDESFGFSAAEIFDPLQEETLKARFPALGGMRIYSDSDAHYLENMRPAQRTVEVSRNTAACVLEALKNGTA